MSKLKNKIEAKRRTAETVKRDEARLRLRFAAAAETDVLLKEWGTGPEG